MDNFLLEYQASGAVLVIRFNRPQRKNALKLSMFGQMSQILSQASQDEKVKIVALTGQGDYFSSGNDLSNFLETDGLDMDAAVETGAGVFQDFVDNLIRFPKVLIALVNGPAVGIMVTTLPLFDVVYASDKATFVTPFSKLGQSLEGGSSFTFLRTMPRGAAMEMLCFDVKLGAREAKERGLVTHVFPDASFQRESFNRLQTFASKPATTLAATKRLIRATEMEQLLKANRDEVETLKVLWKSQECLESVMKFFTDKQSKL